MRENYSRIIYKLQTHTIRHVKYLLLFIHFIMSTGAALQFSETIIVSIITDNKPSRFYTIITAVEIAVLNDVLYIQFFS